MQRILIFALTIAVIGVTAAFLSTRRSDRLGRPGVKVAPYRVLDNEGKEVGTNVVVLPERVEDFQSLEVPVSVMETSWLPVDTTYGKRFYFRTNAPVRSSEVLRMNVVLMGSDRTSIHKPEYCLVGQGWKITHSEFLTLPIAGPSPYQLPVKKLVAEGIFKNQQGQKEQLRAVFVYWFVADGHVSAKHGERMWLMSRELLRNGTLQRWAYVTALIICAPGEEEKATQQIKRFIPSVVPHFQEPPRAAVPSAG